MRIVVHQNKFYDWDPVPSDVVVTPTDIASGKVKAASRAGGWLMRVVKECDTHTTINIPEEQIIAKMIHNRCRPETNNEPISRKQAAAFFLAENILPHHAHRSWITKFEVHDDGHDETMARAMFAPHIEADNIQADELEEHIAAYVEDADAKDHADHLHAHFKVKS